MKVRGSVRTNLDGYTYERWPRWFAGVPRIGERIRAASGKTLRVVGVTHLESPPGEDRPDEPFIEVEVHR